MSVYKAINSVQAALCKTGIGKDSDNKQQGYKFRGIDAVYNALSPLLAQYGLCILPRMLNRSCEERMSKNGSTLFYVTVEAEFDLVCAEDGSKHTVKTYGEAMDSGDKATNKAMSAAYKYAAFQAFAIPTEGDNDADSQSHEIVSAEQQYADLVKANQKTIDTIIEGIANNKLSVAAEAWFELPEETMMALWKSTKNGGCFSTEERRVMKTSAFRESHFGSDTNGK